MGIKSSKRAFKTIDEFERMGLQRYEAWQILAMILGAREMYLLDGAARSTGEQQTIIRALERVCSGGDCKIATKDDANGLYALFHRTGVDPHIIKDWQINGPRAGEILDYPCWGKRGRGGFGASVRDKDSEWMQVWANSCASDLVETKIPDVEQWYANFKQKFGAVGIETKLDIIRDTYTESDAGKDLLDAIKRDEWTQAFANVDGILDALYNYPEYQELIDTIENVQSADEMQSQILKNRPLWTVIAMDLLSPVVMGITVEQYQRMQQLWHERINEHMIR